MLNGGEKKDYYYFFRRIHCMLWMSSIFTMMSLCCIFSSIFSHILTFKSFHSPPTPPPQAWRHRDLRAQNPQDERPPVGVDPEFLHLKMLKCVIKYMLAAAASEWSKNSSYEKKTKKTGRVSQLLPRREKGTLQLQRRRLHWPRLEAFFHNSGWLFSFV